MATHIIDSQKMVVTQANMLATSAYSMTLEEKRLLVLLASMIRQDDDHFKCYHFPAKDVLAFLNLDKNNDAYNRLREITKKLLSRVVDIEAEKYPENTPASKKRWKQFQWIAYAEYIPATETKSGQAELKLQAHSMMRPFLLELKKHFSSIPFAKIAGLPSFHSVRIFEILWAKSYQLRRSKIYIELEELKKILGVKENYANFAHFRQRVLEKAQRDLEQKTPLSFTYTPRTRGRKTIGIEFTVFANANDIQPEVGLASGLQITEFPPMAENNRRKAEQDKLLERMVDDFGFKLQRARELLASYDVDHISRNLDYARRQHGKGIVKNLTAYANRAIVKNYHEDKPIEAPKHADDPASTLEARYEVERKKFIQNTLDEFGYLDLVQEFAPVLEDLLQKNSFLQSQFQDIDNDIIRIQHNPTLNVYFRQFIIDNYAPPQYQSPEAWQEKEALAF